MKLLSPAAVVGTALNLGIVPTVAVEPYAVPTIAVRFNFIKPKTIFEFLCSYNYGLDATTCNQIVL